VNVSPLQFVQPGFVEHLQGLVASGRFDPTRLQLESLFQFRYEPGAT